MENDGKKPTAYASHILTESEKTMHKLIKVLC